jgi:hypothetical protein
MSIINVSEDNTLTINNSEKYGVANNKWRLELDIYKNPICACQDITLKIYDKNNKNNKSPKYHLSFDVFEQQAIRLGSNQTSEKDFRLAELFAHDFTEKDWKQLQKLFLNNKRQIAQSTPIDQFDVPFPEDEIEYDSLMISYTDIFPFEKTGYIELNDIKYFLDDQYCLSSTCSCTHVALTCIVVKNEKAIQKADPLTLLFDYQKESYEIMDQGSENIALPKELVDEIKRYDLGKIYKERHQKLRTIYNNFRKKSQEERQERQERQEQDHLYSFNTPSPPQKPIVSQKIGRNNPCPCGSGKKYKKCCLRKK